MFVFNDEDLPVSARLVKDKLATLKVPTERYQILSGTIPEGAVAVFTTNRQYVPGMAKLIEPSDSIDVPAWAKAFERQLALSQFSDQYFEQFGDGVMEVFDSVAHKILTT